MEDKDKKISIPDPTMGPFGFTIASIKKSFSGLKALIKNPKILLLTLFIAGLQTGLAYLKIYLPTSELVKYASLITFAQGGMYAGLLGAVGGIIGKGFYTWFINTLVFSAFRKKEAKKVRQKSPKVKGAFTLVLAGIGLALVTYNFLSGNASLENSAIGIIAMAASFRTLKKKNGFLVGFICSFTKGRMTTSAASIVIQGMIIGFLFGVLSSLKFSGFWCYLAGVLFLMIALVSLLSRRKVVVTTVALIVLMGSILSVFAVEVKDKWVTPQEAYGIKGDTLTSYIELSNAFNASLPQSMELTLIAVGQTFFSKSVAIEQQKVLVENGQSGNFTVVAQIGEMRLNSLVKLHLEADGYYASSSTAYSIKDNWTNNETEEGTHQDEKKSYFSFGHLGAANYLYEAYLEPGKFYMEINIPFSYGNMAGYSKVDSATQILVRVDLVKRDRDDGSNQPVVGYWQLKETLNYMLRPGDNFVNTMEPFTDQWSGTDVYDEVNVSVTGTEINNVRTRTHASGQWITETTANIEAPASQLKAFDTISLPFSERITFFDSEKNTTEVLSYESANAAFFSGRRGNSFNTKLNANDVMAYPYGANLGQIWLQRSNGQLTSTIPPGTTAGEIMTLELVSTSYEPYDVTEQRLLSLPVIAYIYEWQGGTLPPTDDDEELEEWEEHATEEETGVISALAAIAAVAGAAAAAAGLSGGFGANNTGYIKRNEDGDLVVNDPVTGEQRVYVANSNTGRYTNPLTGAEYSEDELQNSVASRAENAGVLRQDYEQSEQAKAEQRADNQKLSRAENDMHVENKMRNMQRELQQKGQDGDEIAAAMAVKLAMINNQKRETGSFNTKDFEQFKKTHSRWTNGTIAGSSGLPQAESEWEIFKQGLANTGEEIARGESGKSIALRITVSMLVGSFAARQAISAAGAAVIEAGLEFVQATVVMKDYVEKGGNDWKEGAQKAIVKTLQGEAIGRAFGYGLGALGKAASKTGQIMSKTKVGKIIVDNVSDFGEKAGKVLTANIGDVPDVLRKMSKEASKSTLVSKLANAGMSKLKSALTKSGDDVGKSLDDLVKKADKVPGTMKKLSNTGRDSDLRTGQTANASKNLTPESDSLSKAGTKAETASKNAKEASAKTAKGEPIKPKDTAEYKKVSKEVDEALSKAQARAAENIEKFKNNVSKDPNLAARKAAHDEGGKIGLEKVNRLEQARKDLANNPDSAELKKELEKAVHDVQKNKHAQKVMNEKELTSNATRQEFNRLKVEKDAVISLNSSERIAAEYGLDPKNVSNVQATNSMDTGGVGDIKGVAGKGDLGTADGRIPRKFNEGDVDASRLEQKGGDKISIDLDQTYRMKITMKDGTVVYKDLPARNIRQIQNEEVYKAWNDGKLPLKKDGSVDYDKVKEFSEDMDYTVVDARSPDAYGTVGDLQQALKNDGSIRHYGDPEAVSKTIKYKSDEWLERAEFKTGEGKLVLAEGDVAEGIRQATKQFDSQLVYQVKAINTKAGMTRITIPDKLSEGMSVLKQIGHGQGKLSPAEAEAVLKGMGTNTDEILKLNSEQTEFINRLIAGRYKDE